VEKQARLVDAIRTGERTLRRLLFATDRSAASRAAAPVVAGLALSRRAEVVILHVDDQGQPEEAQRVAAEAAFRLIALAINARPEARSAARGHVPDAIAAAAAAHGSDLVVLGSRGRSDLGGLLLGSVGRQVLVRAPCPVLMVRAGRRTSARRGRVLVAVAGDEDVIDLVRMAAAVAEPDASVLVMHLLAQGDGELEFTMSQQLVLQVVKGLRRCGVRARGRVHAGTRGTADEIAGTALTYGADLIVMGSRRLPALAALLHGSVTHRVAHHSDRPVLICVPRAQTALSEK
jgi:nucleotide-binding universal stress UspA family protein